MKGLILCAGKGLGLRPLTLNKSKPAVMLANKPLICHCIEKLLEANIREIGIVIGPRGDDIKDIVSFAFPQLNPVFITQQTPLGIGAAVAEAKDFIAGDSFLLLLGDNVFAENLLGLHKKYQDQSADAVILITHVENPEKFGVVVFEGDTIKEVVEKPKQFISSWAITGAYVFGPAIFSAIANIVPSRRGELEITDAIQWLLAKGKKVLPVRTEQWWLDTGSPQNLLKANRCLLEKEKEGVSLGKDCTVNNCQLVPPVVIGDRCILNDSKIGPFVSVGSDSVLNKVDIRNSLIMDCAVLSNLAAPVDNSIVGSHGEISNVDLNGSLQVLLGDYSTVTASEDSTRTSEDGC